MACDGGGTLEVPLKKPHLILSTNKRLAASAGSRGRNPRYSMALPQRKYSTELFPMPAVVATAAPDQSSVRPGSRKPSWKGSTCWTSINVETQVQKSCVGFMNWMDFRVPRHREILPSKGRRAPFILWRWPTHAPCRRGSCQKHVATFPLLLCGKSITTCGNFRGSTPKYPQRP